VTSSGDAACASYAVQARVDVAVATFVQPYLDATAAAPSGRPVGAIAESAICKMACTSAADCPDALACLPATPDRPAACGITQGVPSSFGAVCAHDSDCGGGGSCARVWPDGADACRCATPCAGGPPMMPGGHGCAFAGTPPDSPPAWLLPALVALVARRRVC
jgi:MYXO-CTERM domain-containing protein